MEKGEKMVKVREDLTGKIFGRLKVIKQAEDYISPMGKHEARWLCSCSCSNKKLEVMGNSLKNGNTTSCGCKVTENIVQINKSKKMYNDYEIQEDYVIMYTSKGEPFLVDLDDFWKVRNVCWSKNKDGYIVSKINRKEIRIHRFILNPPCNMDVDHVGGELTRYDNRKGNLRIATLAENTHNTPPTKRNSSGHKNVSWDKQRQKWVVAFRCNGKNIHVGRFVNYDDACKAEEAAENEYFGEYSYYKSQQKYSDWITGENNE